MVITIPQEDPQTVNPPRAQVLGDETTFGGGQGLETENAQVQQIAQHTNEIATFEKIRADQTAVQGASAKLDDIHQQLINDPKTGLHTYQGVNAMAGHDYVMGEYQKQANEISKTLQPDQQGAFNNMAVTGGKALNDYSMGYVNTQLEQHDTNTFNASMKNKAELGASNYGNPDSINIFKTQMEQIAGARAKRLGLDEDQTTDFMRTQRSNFNESVLSQMVNDPKFQGTAEQYFADHKSEMNLDSQERVEKWLGDGSIKSQSNQLASTLMQAHPNSESAALAAADKTDDPDVRAAARALISSEFKQNRDAKTNDQAQNAEQVLDRVAKSGETDPVRIAQMITPPEKEGMTGAQYNSIIHSQDVRETSASMWMDYTMSVANGSISKMSRADLQEFLSQASPADQKIIIKTWAEGQKDTKNLAPTKTFHEMIDQAALDAKIVSGPKANWDEDQIHNWKALGDEVQQQMEATERASGKKMTPVNQQELINKVVIDHSFVHKGMFSDNQVFVPFDQIPEDFISNSRKEFPNASEDQITKAFTIIKQGGKPNDARAALRNQ